MTKVIDTCQHVNQIKIVVNRDGIQGCVDSLKIGGTWVHLCMCLTCGQVGCCDSSVHKHARRHFEATQHAIIQSVEPGEKWAFCYVDEAFMREPPVSAS